MAEARRNHQQSMSAPTVLIVDAYSTGRYLTGALSARGVTSRHIQSAPIIPDVAKATFLPQEFLSNDVCLDGSGAEVDRLTEVSRQYRPVAVLAGSETGVELADTLSERLGLPSNGVRMSRARREKHLMQEALRENNIPSIPHFESADIETVLEWSRSYPAGVVLKPPASAGAEDVYFCHSENEVRRAFATIYRKRNALNLVNETVVAQELVTGNEFIVNAVSSRGVHRITDIWRCTKLRLPGAGRLSALEALLPYSGVEQSALVHYTYRVIHALRMQYGPSHLELIVTPRGPLLMELAARLQGAIHLGALECALDRTHVEWTADAYLGRDEFFDSALQGYVSKQAVYRVFLIASTTGRLVATPRIEDLTRLDSYYSHSLYVSPGGSIRKTVDYFTSPGLVHLVSSDVSVLDRDYQWIRDRERDDFFVVEA